MCTVDHRTQALGLQPAAETTAAAAADGTTPGRKLLLLTAASSAGSSRKLACKCSWSCPGSCVKDAVDGVGSVTKLPGEIQKTVDPASQYIKVQVRNKCYKSINVAINYQRYTGGRPDVSEFIGVYNNPNDFIGRGLWEVAPGETAYIVDTANRWVVFYAEASDGTKWDGDSCFGFKAGSQVRNVCGFKENVGSNLGGTYTQSFTCN